MKHVFIFFLFLFSTTITYSQQTINEADLVKHWPSQQLSNAAVSDEVVFMNPVEKEVVFICNLARMNGPLFIETILKPYLDSKNLKADRYVRSLIKTLEQQNSLPALQADKVLYQLALNHAKVSGKNGTTGHDGFNDRFQKAKGLFWTFAENCYYGQNNALDISVGLLIDKGVSDLGHRKNILNRELSFVGVSVQPHRSIYEYNCVMDFGGKR